ncbi:DUF1800 family protein [Fodinicola feengrottensis]|nr:DUF1800 family protein [Fodinicola feengrottensis]
MACWPPHHRPARSLRVFAALTAPGKGDKAARQTYAKQLKAQTEQLVLWWLDRMVAADQPWVEKRTLLWHGHWATSVKKVKSPAAMVAQNQTERQLGGADFGAFAKQMVRDPALMIWLDASGNTAKAPNENLARELMELFTLGVGHYSENDVRQAAQALTGWRVDRKAAIMTATFAAQRHASGPQTILGTTADFTDQTLVDLLVSRPDSAPYLATRMWGWLVAPTPPSASSLARITSAYGPKRDLTAMFRAIFSDPAFLDADSVIEKQPIDYAVGMFRDLKLRPSTVGQEAPVRPASGAGRAGTGAVRSAECRRLADRWRLADHVGRAGSDQARRVAGQGRRSQGAVGAKRQPAARVRGRDARRRCLDRSYPGRAFQRCQRSGRASHAGAGRARIHRQSLKGNHGHVDTPQVPARERSDRRCRAGGRRHRGDAA